MTSTVNRNTKIGVFQQCLIVSILTNLLKHETIFSDRNTWFMTEELPQDFDLES